MRKYESRIVLAIFALWVIGFAFQTGRSTQHQEDRKQIEVAYKTSHGIQDQKRANQSDPGPNEPTNSHTENRSGEAPEITFIGLKLGEGLLIFVTIWLVLVTKALVDGAKESSERQLRAYVSITQTDVAIGGTAVVAVFTFRNDGVTPAYRLSTSIKSICINERIKKFSPRTLPAGEKQPSIGIIGPNTPGEMRLVADYAAEFGSVKAANLIKSIESGECTYYIWGDIDFWDAFNQHWTVYFCGRVVRMPGDDKWKYPAEQ